MPAAHVPLHEAQPPEDYLCCLRRLARRLLLSAPRRSRGPRSVSPRRTSRRASTSSGSRSTRAPSPSRASISTPRSTSRASTSPRVRLRRAHSCDRHREHRRVAGPFSPLRRGPRVGSAAPTSACEQAHPSSGGRESVQRARRRCPPRPMPRHSVRFWSRSLTAWERQARRGCPTARHRAEPPGGAAPGSRPPARRHRRGGGCGRRASAAAALGRDRPPSARQPAPRARPPRAGAPRAAACSAAASR